MGIYQGLRVKGATGHGSPHETKPDGNGRPFGTLLMMQKDWDSVNHFALHHSAKRKGTNCALFEWLKTPL